MSIFMSLSGSPPVSESWLYFLNTQFLKVIPDLNLAFTVFKFDIHVPKWGYKYEIQ